MLRKVLYVVLGLMAIALIGGLMTDAPCASATEDELATVSGFGAQATSGWRVESGSTTFVAVPIAGDTAVFGYGTLEGAEKPIWAAVNTAARSVSEQGVDIPADSPAGIAVGLGDTAGIAAAEACATR